VCAVVRALGLAVALLACSHDAVPVAQPDPHPPLPEGTPIGYLIDDATELALRDDQLTQLKVLDTELAAKIDALEATQRRQGARPAAANGQPTTGRRRGGRRGGGRRGGGAGGGSGSAAVKSTGQSPTPTADTNQRTEDRAAAVRDALAAAFALLDPVQRAMASRVLSQHGVDLDAGRSAAGPAAPSPPTEAEPTEPDPDGD
jgi:hypothetical protein